MGRKRNKQEKNCKEVSAKKRKLHGFVKGDLVLCSMEMGVWWPGFVSECYEKHLAIGFFKENTEVSRTLAKVKPFKPDSPLISTSLNKLKKRKRLNLEEKYLQDVTHCTTESRNMDHSPLTQVEDQQSQTHNVDQSPLIPLEVQPSPTHNVDQSPLTQVEEQPSQTHNVDQSPLPQVEAQPSPTHNVDQSPLTQVEEQPSQTHNVDKSPLPQVEEQPSQIHNVDQSPLTQVEEQPSQTNNVDQSPLPQVEEQPSQTNNVDQSPLPQVEVQPTQTQNVDQSPLTQVEEQPSQTHNVDQSPLTQVEEQPSQNVDQLPLTPLEVQPSRIHNVDQSLLAQVEEQPSRNVDQSPLTQVEEQPSQTHNVDKSPLPQVEEQPSQTHNVDQSPLTQVEEQPSQTNNVDQSPLPQVEEKPSQTNNVDQSPLPQVEVQPTQTQNVDQSPLTEVEEQPSQTHNVDQSPLTQVEEQPSQNVDQLPLTPLEVQPSRIHNVDQSLLAQVDEQPSRNVDQSPLTQVEEQPSQTPKVDQSPLTLLEEQPSPTQNVDQSPLAQVEEQLCLTQNVDQSPLAQVEEQLCLTQNVDQSPLAQVEEQPSQTPNVDQSPLAQVEEQPSQTNNVDQSPLAQVEEQLSQTQNVDQSPLAQEEQPPRRRDMMHLKNQEKTPLPRDDDQSSLTQEPAEQLEMFDFENIIANVDCESDDDINDPDWEVDKEVSEDGELDSETENDNYLYFRGNGDSDIIPDSEEDGSMSPVYFSLGHHLKSLTPIGENLESLDHQMKSVNPSTEDTSSCLQSQVLPESRQIPPEECKFDENNPKIYTKAYKQDANRNNSKHGRTYDNVHACVYCNKLMTNIQTHLEHKHRKESEIQQILELRKQLDTDTHSPESDTNTHSPESDTNTHSPESAIKEKIHSLQKLLRNKGNHRHNQKVIAAKQGEIMLSRRRSEGTFDIRMYGPCADCFEWIILENLYKHQKSCPGKEKSDMSKSSLILQAKILNGKISAAASARLKKEVFPCMTRDKVSETAQEDTLIIALGDVWLVKNIGNKMRRKHFTSFRMRLAARLLILLRRESGVESGTMSDFLKPHYFDLIVKCAIKACEENEHEEMKNPSTALKLGYDLSRLAALKMGFSIKKGDESTKEESSNFQKLLQLEWNIKVSKIARVTLDTRKFNNKKELPHPKDIEKLALYLVKQLEELDLTECDIDVSLFREVVILTETRLLLYNRRRPGELESLSVDAYNARSTTIDDADLALRQNLTEFEKLLLTSQDLVEIRGKTGRGVPVIIPGEVKRMLDFLSNSSNREKGGIKEDNKFMFANTGHTVLRAGDALNNVKGRPNVNLAFPDRLYATNLRKHTATIAQALSLNEQEMKWVCNHLGHTQKVHDQFYRQTSGLIERLDIAKLMLLQEHNLVAKYSNKKLSDIQFDEIVGDLEDGMTSEDGNGVAADTRDNPGDRFDDVDVRVPNFSDVFDLLEEPNGGKKATKVMRVKWSKGEEDEIRKYFKSYFNGDIKKMCPSQEHCRQAIARSEEDKGFLCKRKWETIKKKVSNMLHKVVSRN